MPAEGRTLPRTAGWIALAYAVALAVPNLWGGIVYGDGAALVGAFVAATWTAAPVVAAAGFVAASPTRLGMMMFLAFELILIASFGWVFVDVLFVHPSSMGGMVFITWPLAQWIAIVIVSIVAFLLGWRGRPDFLNEQAPPVSPPPRA